MSLLNAWIARDEALVAVDTEGVSQTGGSMPTSKLLPIPHLAAAVALRGQAAMLTFLYVRILTSGFATFDQLNDALPELVPEIDAGLPDALIAKNFPIGNELLVVGWSDAEQRMLGRQFNKRDGEAFTDRFVDYHISPWHHSIPDIPKDAAALDFIARAQVRWMRENYPNAACGGRLLQCKLYREGTVIRQTINLPVEEVA